MRSVVVVLPASMWAMMPMFRTVARSSKVLAMRLVPRSVSDTRLPAVVSEGPVRFGHLVRVLTLLDGRPETVAGVDQLVHQTLGHALLSALTRESDQPAQGQRGGPGGTNLDRHLVGRATDTAAADLERGLDAVQGALEHDKRVLAGLFLSTLQSVVDNTLGERTLAVDQHLVDQCGDERRVVDRVGGELALRRRALARHAYFSFLAP